MRILKYHLPIAILSGLIIYAVLQVSAWYNLRDQRNLCRRQGLTRNELFSLENRINDHKQETGEYPRSLKEAWTDPGEEPPEDLDAKIPDRWTRDEWDHPYVYTVDGEGFTLKSLGRDGKPGGIGLDADLYHDDRNHNETLPTFEQFFTETDTAEVDRGPSKILSLLGAAIVAITLLSNLVKEDRQERFSLRYMLLVSGAVVIGAIAIGLFLLPLHVPSGH